jgi:branched-chain amino acid aminotransferase
VDVLVSDRYARAFPGGTGDVKPAGNYGGAMLADREAKEQGCQSVLWLDAMEHRYVEECGVMNVFAAFRDRILTPPLTGTILPGVTRASVITLLRSMGHVVEETRFTIQELMAAHERGDLREFFGTGTAATVTSVRSIRYQDRTATLPAIASDGVGAQVRDRLVGLASGRDADSYGWVEPA